MSKIKVSKNLHECEKCGRLSAAASVLRESKDKKGVISYHCTNAKKCDTDKKSNNLVNGKRKIVRAKKAAPKKAKGNGKGKKVTAKKAEKGKSGLKPIAQEEAEAEAKTEVQALAEEAAKVVTV